MKIYFSGIGGVAIGPLMEITYDAGYDVAGSDLHENLMTQHLRERGLAVYIGQDGSQLAAEHQKQPIDWFVYTAAASDDNPELIFAREHGIRTSKRDELLAEIIAQNNLKLIAVAGTHGKTTTSGMLVWAFERLGIPISYSVGSTLSFGPSGKFDPASEYFVYECDEFDRNFLHFSPWLSLITSVDYDHPDTFPTEDDYRAAFRQFGQQSGRVITWQDKAKVFDTNNLIVLEKIDPRITLVGEHNRRNATLAMAALSEISAPEYSPSTDGLATINSFPGTGRRFEKLANNLYSDYGHHPVEINATLQMAHELSDSVILVYQPHQNIRQYEIRHQYTNEVFADADQIYWLPTYLSREDPKLPILAPKELTASLDQSKVHFADFNDELWQNITQALRQNKLVLCMGAGDIDSWVRQQLKKS